ncbi:MAG TPA: metallophosphoesterase [Candidatus Paceibacterota bacterium]|nr:metallophosphoesterase [Verrucomicrobiota bacterium]HRY50291.1 metallophosphoesterase [Candidatus Paceibacterota bacterium]HSA03254.1 metallophosphoesterase [Candidatus Paceibacterota bacterium]
MAEKRVLLILSDIHYASSAEKARGGHERAAIDQPLLRLLVHGFRHFFWLRDPHAHNHMLDRFLECSGEPDWVVANGDYSCDSAFVGVSDDAACISVRECLSKLNARFGSRFMANFGDHELGKMSLFGGKGGLRLASWHRATHELNLKPFWQETVGAYRLMGVTSSLLALPVFEPETLPEERPEWCRLRNEHIDNVSQAFESLNNQERVILFCHDPTALPWLWRCDAVRQRIDQIEQTWIGHLHSPLVLWKSRRLAGMPMISFLGTSIRRMTSALREARHWRPFKLRLCPSLTGTQLLKDGGFYEVRLDPEAAHTPQVLWHPLAW